VPHPLTQQNGTFARDAALVFLLRGWRRNHECALKPKDVFRECDNCPEMVVAPAGTFVMGSPTSRTYDPNIEAQVRVTIAQPFAVGRFAVTFAEWDACVADGGCKGYRPDDFLGRDRRPVINVNWDHAKLYIDWLNAKTGKTYRLLSEAEREYVTRAGTTTPFWWGAAITPKQANYDVSASAEPYIGARGEYLQQTVPVDSFQPNPWGLYQVHGNVWEWTEDCWNDSNQGNPGNGSARTTGDCGRRVVRGGSWLNDPQDLRSAYRRWFTTDFRDVNLGFRLARRLNP
jgi:formylglycine-generating enzyme required for sulfatase activity